MSADEASVFGTRLRDARKRAGLSQKQLGIDAGLDPFVASTRINRYELGVHKVDFQFAQRLASILSVPVSYLYTDDLDLAELIQTYGQLADEQRARLIAFARELALL